MVNPSRSHGPKLALWESVILKHKDDITPALKSLEALRVRPDLSEHHRQEIEEELWNLRSGARGEKEAAYHIDFHFADFKWIAVIHDLRIEHKGRVAQIDHLILDRLLEVHVIESKNFSGEVRVSADGEWEINTRKGWRGTHSPVEQNRRHIDVLKDFIRDHGLAPRRVGLALNPTFQNWVLVSPRCQLKRTGKEWQNVVKMDLFIRRYREHIDKTPTLSEVASITKIVAADTLFAFANSLVAAHKPASIDYPWRFGFANSPLVAQESPPRPVSSGKSCEACGLALEPKVVAFCRYNSRRFGKRLLCRACQTSVVTA